MDILLALFINIQKRGEEEIKFNTTIKLSTINCYIVERTCNNWCSEHNQTFR